MDLIEELDIKVIDCDTHIVEAYDLWTSRVSVSKYGERVPHVKKNEQGVECWYSNGEMLTPAAGIACAGYREHPPRHAATLEDIDMRAYEPQARDQLPFVLDGAAGRQRPQHRHTERYARVRRSVPRRCADAGGRDRGWGERRLRPGRGEESALPERLAPAANEPDRLVVAERAYSLLVPGQPVRQKDSGIAPKIFGLG